MTERQCTIRNAGAHTIHLPCCCSALHCDCVQQAWTKMMENGVNFDKKTQINLKP